ERHHEIGDMVEPLPSPSVEFRGLSVARRQRINLIVASGEAEREPFLSLAAEFREPVRRTMIGREFVSEPISLAKKVGIPDAGLLPQFAACRGLQVFAVVDATLRHLPFEAGQNDLGPIVAKAAADQHASIAIEQRDPHIGAKGLWRRHSGFSTRRSYTRSRRTSPELRSLIRQWRTTVSAAGSARLSRPR